MNKTIIIVAENMDEAIKGLKAINSSVEANKNVMIVTNAEDIKDHIEVVKEDKGESKKPKIDETMPRSILKKDNKGETLCVYKNMVDASLGENIPYHTLNTSIQRGKEVNGFTFEKNNWDITKSPRRDKNAKKTKYKIYSFDNGQRLLEGIFDKISSAAEFLGCSNSSIKDSAYKGCKIRKKYLVVREK